VQVNTNGDISFRSSFTSFIPRPFPSAFPPLIAPYWADFNSVRGGTISYRQTSNSTLLQRVRGQIQEFFPSTGNFIPTDLFIATWDQVPGFSFPSLVGIYFFICSVISSIQHMCISQTVYSQQLILFVCCIQFDLQSDFLLPVESILISR